MSATAQVSEQKQTGFKRVLIATDFSPASEYAVEWALAIARRDGARVTLVHALASEPREFVPMDSPPELDRPRLKAEQQMKQLAEKAAEKGITCQPWVERGRAGDVVASFVEREDADLIVLGTHGRGGIGKITLGSVAEEVLRRANCPVLTVGPHVMGPGTAAAGAAKFRCVLFATDFGPASVQAFPYALSTAESQGAKLVLVHMFPLLPAIAAASYAPAVCGADDLDQWQAQARIDSLKTLKKLIPPGTKLTVPPEFVVGTDFLPEGILTAAKQHHADLIVMGANRADSAHTVAHVPWSVAYQVIAQAQCPVLTVRG